MVGVASAFYGPSDDVIELTPANFDSQVVNSADVWVIEFYAPWSVCVCVCVFVCVCVCVCAGLIPRFKIKRVIIIEGANHFHQW